MTRKSRSIAIMLVISMLALLVILVARAWIDAGPIVDLRL
jgi:hypothetical protein